MNFLENKDGGFNPYIVIVVAVFLLIYLINLIFGENSISALIKAKNQKEALEKEYNRLQKENQELQKDYFELIQLTPDIDAF